MATLFFLQFGEEPERPNTSKPPTTRGSDGCDVLDHHAWFYPWTREN